MLVDEVEKLISERNIVACNIRDLRTININNKDSANFAKKIEESDFNKCVTFLYKIDDEHYMEYFSGIVVTTIDNYEIQNCEILSKFEEKYNNNPIVILKSDLRYVDEQEKNKFKNNNFDDITLKIFLKNIQEIARINLREQFAELLLEMSKDEYVEKVFNDLKGRKVYLVRISDLQKVVLNRKEEDDKFKYEFRRENRTIFQTLETTNFTLLIEIGPTLYREYYSDTKILIGNNDRVKSILKPKNFIEFDDNYNFLLEYPLIAARELQEYNEDTKYLIRENFGKEKEIKKIIETISTKSLVDLKIEYDKIKILDEIDAYADNALVNIALRLKNENTENGN